MAIQHFFAGPATVSVQTRTPATGAVSSSFDLGINREAIPIIVTPSMRMSHQMTLADQMEFLLTFNTWGPLRIFNLA